MSVFEACAAIGTGPRDGAYDSRTDSVIRKPDDLCCCGGGGGGEGEVLETESEGDRDRGPYAASSFLGCLAGGKFYRRNSLGAGRDNGSMKGLCEHLDRSADGGGGKERYLRCDFKRNEGIS